MNFIYSIILTALTFLLVSCADTNSLPPTFNQFLYNQSSMTRQLEQLDNSLQVVILYSGTTDGDFKRITSLNLKGRPVIIGLSQAKSGSPYFIDLLSHADTTPLGKTLFAPGSGIARDPNMIVEQVYLNYISDQVVKRYIMGLGYTNSDVIYKRTSIFRKGKEYMQVIEYVLPSIHTWIQ